MLKQFFVNVLLIGALHPMPGYGKFMKDLVLMKRSVSFESADNLYHCSVTATRSLVEKKNHPGSFTILCTIIEFNFAKALCDLGVCINFIPLIVYI